MIDLGKLQLSCRHGEYDLDSLNTLVIGQIQTAATKLDNALVDVEAYPQFIYEAIESLIIAFVLLSHFDELIQTFAVFTFQSDAWHC